MSNAKSGQSTGNQVAFPTDQLYAAAANYFKSGDGEHSQMQRALEVGSYFLSGCMAVNLSQFLGAPLYLINENWYNAWIALTKQSIGILTTTLTQYWAPTVVRVSGDKSVRGQLVSTSNGGLRCLFPQRMVLIANHQIYTDWLYLWWIAYCNGMHGSIFIVLKESLRSIPILGWGMRLSQFIFLKRDWEQDKPQMAKHFQKLNKPTLPMWLLIFPEGTNLAESTRERSAKWAKKNGIQDMQHTLLPRSTGLRFSLQQMRESVRYVYDCTIAYEGVPRGQYAQDIFTVKSAYFEGHPPKSINMYWRRFALSSIPIDDPVAFEVWLRARWMEKDSLIEAYYRHGRFPADRGAHKTREGKIIRGAGHIETEIKSNYWYEFLQIFAPVGVLAMVLYMFYNALPTTVTESLKSQDMLKKAEELQKAPINGRKQPHLMHSANNVPIDQDSVFARAATIYKGVSKNLSVQKVVRLPELSEKGLKNEMKKHQPALDTIFTQKNALQDMRTKLPSRPATQKNPVQRTTNTPAQKSASVPKSTLQRPPTAKPPAPKSASAKALQPKQTAKQPPPAKLANNKIQVASTPARKLPSKPTNAGSKSASSNRPIAK
ncbi:hypothetical protein GJ744_006026 [Endocarpon pusillum]|uniref:Phospholipid/glycerol acyltransferase domain-containing protein n=1 Tax=Endocarpon pusillum TaxID=364733 RepID=A0A8H7ABR7_9EURO|nr:hypothetical protein GJ744_006026 [Endocarpon pusillum]